MNERFLANERMRAEVFALIDAELAAERERCAKIAEAIALNYGNSEHWHLGWEVGSQVAAAIRKGE
jgi:hypothetical protein